MTLETLIPDYAVNEVFANTNFGVKPRQVISETIKNINDGHSCGHTATICCIELGLVLSPKPRTYVLSMTGIKYLDLLNLCENEKELK